MAAPVIAAFQAGFTTIPKPTGTANGDLLVAFVSANTVATNFTPPAGWTKLASAAVTSGIESAVYTKTAASEPASWTWSFSGAPTDTLIMIYRITGWTVAGTPSFSGAAWGTHIQDSVAAISDPETLAMVVGVGYNSSPVGALLIPSVAGISVGTLASLGSGTAVGSANSRLQMAPVHAVFKTQIMAGAPITYSRTGSGTAEQPITLNVSSGSHQGYSQFM